MKLIHFIGRVLQRLQISQTIVACLQGISQTSDRSFKVVKNSAHSQVIQILRQEETEKSEVDQIECESVFEQLQTPANQSVERKLTEHFEKYNPSVKGDKVSMINGIIIEDSDINGLSCTSKTDDGQTAFLEAMSIPTGRAISQVFSKTGRNRSPPSKIEKVTQTQIQKGKVLRTDFDLLIM